MGPTPGQIQRRMDTESLTGLTIDPVIPGEAGNNTRPECSSGAVGNINECCVKVCVDSLDSAPCELDTPQHNYRKGKAKSKGSHGSHCVLLYSTCQSERHEQGGKEEAAGGQGRKK